MDKNIKQQMLESLIAFGKMYQLPTPSRDYFEVLRAVLHNYKWRLSEFNNALQMLLTDDRYADSARFGKYPTINDFLRVRQKLKSAAFYRALGEYLSGDGWKKDEVLSLATPEQKNALLTAGGLSNLYLRANGDVPTPIYKLVDIVVKNEMDAPTELIDTDHRIGTPMSFKQLMQQ